MTPRAKRDTACARTNATNNNANRISIAGSARRAVRFEGGCDGIVPASSSWDMVWEWPTADDTGGNAWSELPTTCLGSGGPSPCQYHRRCRNQCRRHPPSNDHAGLFVAPPLEPYSATGPVCVIVGLVDVPCVHVQSFLKTIHLNIICPLN